ncbi:hypothetical protein PM082_007443 [Marasmius tenuissimus]|nr:hypothetical protein PM082_007443 [Marasmius tenuissimus]
MYRNVNYGRDQNVHNGSGQFMVGGEMKNAGRDFINNCYTVVQASPQRNIWSMLSRVGASHKAEQQFERGECLPGTRERALGMIHDWWSTKQQDHPICWLSGAAGVGKSAITMTVAQECESESSLVSSFFFFRSDPNRNNPSALWLTVAHGLTLTMPILKNAIEERILNDPTVLGASIEHQFRNLILNPAPDWSWPRDFTGVLSVPTVIVIDGLDECGDEQTQLRIMSTIRTAFEQVPHCPLRFLICSRPESWIQEAFADEPLSHLSKRIVLDNSLAAREDIRQYYRHHFHEIATSRKYSHVQFPSPWPSERDLEILVVWTCGQFVYAATVIKFITLAYNHPIAQLQIILDSHPNVVSTNSPYHDLDCLYDVILQSNPNHSQLLPILAAILVLPKYLEPTPARIELVLGLRSGQVALTLRGMHSVLDIGDRGKGISFYHSSFRDYLVDQTKSGQFHIDILTQEHIIVRQWLQNLATSKVRDYSTDQLYSAETSYFFTEWMNFCTSISMPTRDLLDNLRSVDLASVYLVYCEIDGECKQWEDVFRVLVPWVKKYHDPKLDGSKDEQARDHTRAGESIHDLKCNGHLPNENSQRGLMAHSYEMDEDWDRLGLVKGLVHKLKTHPESFHLEYLPGVSPREGIPHLISLTTQCPFRRNGQRWVSSDSWQHTSFGPISRGLNKFRLADCGCNPSRGSGSCDPGHLTYQDACLRLVKAHISRFEGPALKGLRDDVSLDDMSCIFENMVASSLLKSCRLDAELLSLCRMFFGLAKGCKEMVFDHARRMEGRKNLLEWIKTFPDLFAEEGEVLRAQILALPWQQWEENWKNCYG